MDFKLLILISLILLISCDKKNTEPQQKNGFKVDVLGFTSAHLHSNGLPTIWIDNGKIDTTFIPFNHNRISIQGAHDLLTSGGRNLVYYGTEIINGQNRIVAFTYEGKKILSDEVNLYLMPDRDENLYAHHRDKEGNLYLLSTCQTTGYRRVSYAYKVDKYLAIEKIEMPLEIYFAVFDTPKGLISLKTTLMSPILEVTVGHQTTGLDRINVNFVEYDVQQVHSAYQNQLGRLHILVSALEKTSRKNCYFLVNIDPTTRNVIRHTLHLPNERYQFGKGLMEENVLYLPGAVNNSNKAFQFRIDTQTDLVDITPTKTELEIDSRFPTAQTLFVQRLEGSLYIGGTQFGKACYWKDGKLILLESNPETIRSYPVQFLGYRI